MTKYEKYCYLRDAKGLTDAKVAAGAEVTKSTFSDWKSGRSEPKEEKLKKIADFLGVPLSKFYEDEEIGYYYDPETAKLAQEIYDNKELGLLMSASRKMKPESLRHLASLVESMVRRENGDVDT